MIPEGRFETSRISPGNTSKLLKIHNSNFHRISISLAEVRLASGPCLESRLLFPSPTITLFSLAFSLFIFFLTRFFTCDLCIFSTSRTAIPDWVTAIRMAFTRGVVLALYLSVILISIHAIPVGWPPWPPWLPSGLHPWFCLALSGSIANWTATDEQQLALVTSQRSPVFISYSSYIDQTGLRNSL